GAMEVSWVPCNAVTLIDREAVVGPTWARQMGRRGRAKRPPLARQAAAAGAPGLRPWRAKLASLEAPRTTLHPPRSAPTTAILATAPLRQLKTLRAELLSFSVSRCSKIEQSE